MGRALIVKHTDGFVCSLIREALADGSELERFKLSDAVARLAKQKYRKRNSPQYRLVQASLAVLLKHNIIEHRYAPFHLKPDDESYGTHFYKLVQKEA